MANINWMEEVEKRKDALIKDFQGLLRIKSVRNERECTDDAPFGQGVRDALDYMLRLGERDQFHTKNVGNVAGHIEIGTGEQLVGILCHVDVVPEGKGWTVDPFSGIERDGKIFARGAIDDKGPTIAAYYAMKIVNELSLPLKKRVRMIIGTDEESEWRCVDHYFQQEEMPHVGFAPDAEFPIIHAEKGIIDFDLIQQIEQPKENGAQMTLISFTSGSRYNMVPDHAQAVIDISYDQTELLQQFNYFKEENNITGRYYVESGYLMIEVEGVASHGMEPNKGKNAGLILAKFLSTITLDKRSQTFIQATTHLFYDDSRGKALDIQYKDEHLGEVTINVGILSYHEDEGGRLGLNMRYPATFPLKDGIEKISKKAEEVCFSLKNMVDLPPHHVPVDDPLVQTLIKVYEEQTNEQADLLAISGGTYARALQSGVAFGPLFPGRQDVAHEKDEYIIVEDLLKATALYAQAIFELAR